MRQYPDAFAGHDVEDAIQNDLMLFYLPMALAGLRMMASFPGKGLSKETLVYYEVLDWAYSRANYLDVRLMGILEPWDFGKVGPFDPAMQEGDFRVVSIDASTKDQMVIDKLALDIAGNDAEVVLGLNKKSIRAWARKARKLKDSLVMVPAYFVDRPATDSRDGEQVRIAVNGQAARAAARRIKENARISSQLENRRRKGESGKAWQILQQRIDMRQTTENDNISGIDKSSEARGVRAGMAKTIGKLKQAMEEARHDDDSELGAELRKMDELNERLTKSGDAMAGGISRCSRACVRLVG